jgi:NAD(P)-dependent dehydrogenase (short-subunit alcohol dehydrogenase family)
LGRLDGKVALVTGAAHERGIGRGIVRALAEEGARVAVNDVAHEEMGEELAQEVGGRFYRADVSHRAEVDELVRRVESELGPLDAVVSNAGVADWQPFVEITDSSFDRIVAVNLTGAFNVGQAAARAMVARGRGGRIVFTSSVHVQMPFPTMAVYGASKGALLALTRCAALEWAPHGIRVNAVAPGLTETPLVEAWLAQQDDPDGYRAEVTAQIPQGRMATPDDVAAAVLFLASDDAAHVTGTSLAVDGGYTAG